MRVLPSARPTRARPIRFQHTIRINAAGCILAAFTEDLHGPASLPAYTELPINWSGATHLFQRFSSEPAMHADEKVLLGWISSPAKDSSALFLPMNRRLACPEVRKRS